MSRVGRLAVGTAIVVGATIAWQQPAFAACHRFDVTVSPTQVAEGGTVTVTVERDGAVGPSNVDVSSVNETAQAGSDFQPVQRRVTFTSETQQTFTVPVTNDATAEPDETFRLHLSNPGGCSINPNFSLGPDAQVTIRANDAPPPTTAPPSTAPPTTPVTPTTTREATTTTTTAAGEETTTATSTTTASSTTTTTTEPSTTTTESDEVALAASEDDGDGGGSSVGMIAAVVAVLALGGGGLLLYRRRPGPMA